MKRLPGSRTVVFATLSDEGRVLVDSVLGIFVSVVGGALMTGLPLFTPASTDVAARTTALLAAARTMARSQGVVVLQYTKTATGVQVVTEAPGGTAYTDAVTGIKLGLQHTDLFDGTFSAATDSDALTLPFTVRFAADGDLRVGGATCNSLTLAWTNLGTTDSTSVSCPG